MTQSPSSTPPPLLVTGASGHSGGYFLRELNDSGYTGYVRFLVRTGSKLEAVQQARYPYDVVTCDLTDPDSYREAMQGIHTVLHISSIFHSLGVVAAALPAGVQRLILVHTTGVYSQYKQASADYLEIERQVHALLAASPNPPSVTILRPTMIFGRLSDQNMAVFIRMVDLLPIIPLVDGGRSLLQPVHAADLGHAYLQLLNSTNTDLDELVLSGDRPREFRDIMRLISRGLSKRRLFVPVPMWASHTGARLIRAVTAGRIDPVERVLRMGENRAFSHDLASAEIGYAPQPFEVGLRREIDEYLDARARSRGAAAR